MSRTVAESAPPAPHGFPANERRLLLSLPRIGPTVVARIEAQGIASLRDLQRHGVEQVVDAICLRMSTRAWVNRRSALASALDALAQRQPEPCRDGEPDAAGLR